MRVAWLRGLQRGVKPSGVLVTETGVLRRGNICDDMVRLEELEMELLEDAEDDFRHGNGSGGDEGKGFRNGEVVVRPGDGMAQGLPQRLFIGQCWCDGARGCRAAI